MIGLFNGILLLDTLINHFVVRLQNNRVLNKPIRFKEIVIFVIKWVKNCNWTSSLLVHVHVCICMYMFGKQHVTVSALLSNLL